MILTVVCLSGRVNNPNKNLFCLLFATSDIPTPLSATRELTEAGVCPSISTCQIKYLPVKKCLAIKQITPYAQAHAYQRQKSAVKKQESNLKLFYVTGWENFSKQAF